jgi:aminoglycoside phosphotransferase (APT) family kinase protein
VHVLIGDADRPVGIIDFEDAWLGDPATDLMPLAACLGNDLLPRLTAGRDLGERLEERLGFYRWMGSIHAIIYGVRQQVDHERQAGVRELRRRLPAD